MDPAAYARYSRKGAQSQHRDADQSGRHSRRVASDQTTFNTQTIQFLIAIGFGIVLGTSEQGLGASVAWVVGGALILSLVTTVLEGRRLPRSMQSPYGVTLPRGLFVHLFFGTITTITIPTVLVRLLVGVLR